MVEGDLVMADNAVIKISHVKRAVRAELHVNRPEPGIVSAEEIGFFLRDSGGSVFDQGIAVDATGHYISDEGIVAKFRGKIVGGIEHHSGDGGRSVAVFANIRSEAKAVVGFAEAGIIGAAQQVINGGAVAIGGPKIAERIEHEPEGIDLAPGVLLNAGTVHPEPVGIAGIHFDGAAIFGGEGGIIVVTVIGVDPTIIPAAKRAGEPVDVPVKTLAAEDNLLFIRAPVAVDVLEKIDVGDAETDDAIFIGVQADRDIQAIGEGGGLAGAAIFVEIGQHLDHVARRFVEWGGIGIFP